MRVIAIVALLGAIWSTGCRGGDETNLRRALSDWTTASVRLTLDSTPSPVDRDWLAALRRSGVPVTWTWRRQPPTPLAVAATPIPDPAGATRVAVAAPNGTQVVIADRLGPIDTGRAASGGLTVAIPGPLHTVRASGAHATVADSLVLRRLLVLGTVSWEAKFVVRALEERGWLVDTRLRLGPGHDVLQGHQMLVDTAHYAAVLAMDSGARSATAEISRYANHGGGVIVAGSAARVLDAIPSARNVLRVSADDTWRIRMDSARGPAVHRDLWAGLVAKVAYAPKVRGGHPVTDDPAPVAETIDRLGPPAPAKGTGPSWPAAEVWFAVIAAALFAEWASRRLRGAT